MEETDEKRRMAKTDGKRWMEETDGKSQEHVVDDEQPYRDRTAVAQVLIPEGVINQAIQKLFGSIEARTRKDGLQLMELDTARLLTEEAN